MQQPQCGAPAGTKNSRVKPLLHGGDAEVGSVGKGDFVEGQNFVGNGALREIYGAAAI